MARVRWVAQSTSSLPAAPTLSVSAAAWILAASAGCGPMPVRAWSSTGEMVSLLPRPSDRTAFRDHSRGDSQRLSGNIGWQLGSQAETRFYLSGLRARQELPGSLTRRQALAHPEQA